MVLYVILGISVDNIFVMFDAWQQSKAIEEYEGNLRRRISYTIRRSNKSLAIASLTTAVAMFSCLLSKIMPVRAFGLYTGLVVLANYILIIALLPPLIVFHEKYLKYICCEKKESKGAIISRDSMCVKFFGHFNTFVRRLRWFLVFAICLWVYFMI